MANEDKVATHLAKLCWFMGGFGRYSSKFYTIAPVFGKRDLPHPWILAFFGPTNTRQIEKKKLGRFHAYRTTVQQQYANVHKYTTTHYYTTLLYTATTQ